MVRENVAALDPQVTVLVVEDHDRTRAVICDWLHFVFPEFEVLEAGDGEQALALARQHPPQLVLMDVELPGMKGIETTRRIKLAVPRAQVVALSLYAAPEYRSAALTAGAAAYVPKNQMHVELAPAVRALLNLH